MTLDMTPTIPMNDVGHAHGRYSELLGYSDAFLSLLPQKSDFKNLSFRQFSAAMLASNIYIAAFGCSSLSLHVSHVVSMRSKEKVIWIHASRIVAAVEHARPVIPVSSRDGTFECFIRNSMRSLIVVAHSNGSVGIAFLRISNCFPPNPTSTRGFKATAHSDALRGRYSTRGVAANRHGTTVSINIQTVKRTLVRSI